MMIDASVRLLKVLLVHWLDHEVQHRGHTHQTSHCVHRVVVDEWRGIDGSLWETLHYDPIGVILYASAYIWHDGHEFGDGECLGLDKSIGL